MSNYSYLIRFDNQETARWLFVKVYLLVELLTTIDSLFTLRKSSERLQPRAHRKRNVEKFPSSDGFMKSNDSALEVAC